MPMPGQFAFHASRAAMREKRLVLISRPAAAENGRHSCHHRPALLPRRFHYFACQAILYFVADQSFRGRRYCRRHRPLLVVPHTASFSAYWPPWPTTLYFATADEKHDAANSRANTHVAISLIRIRLHISYTATRRRSKARPRDRVHSHHGQVPPASRRRQRHTRRFEPPLLFDAA